MVVSSAERKSAIKSLFWDTNAGRAAAFAAVVTICYAIWIYFIPHALGLGELVSNLLDALLSVTLLGYSFFAWKSDRIDPRLRRSWIIMMLAFLASAAGECLWFVNQSLLQIEPFISSADVFYFLYYPLLLIAVLFLPYSSPERNETKVLVMDLAIVLTTSFIFLWYFILIPASVARTNGWGALLAIAYPAGEIVILAAVIALMQRKVEVISWWTLVFLGFGLVIDALADGFFAYYSIRNMPTELAWMNVLWLSSYVCMLTGVAWEMIPDESVRKRAPIVLSDRRLLRTIIPYIAAIAAVLLLIFAVRNTEFSDIRFQGILIATLVLAVEVLVRQYLIL